jgi:hypothetical protein
MALNASTKAIQGAVGVDSQPTISTANGAEVAFGALSWTLSPRFAHEPPEIGRIRALERVPVRNRRLTANTASELGTAR